MPLFADPCGPSVTNFPQVSGHHRCDRMCQCRLFEITVDPRALNASEHCINAGFVNMHRPVIEIRCVVEMAGVATCIEFDVKHLLRDCSPIAILQ